MANMKFVKGDAGNEGNWKPSLVARATSVVTDPFIARWAKTRARLELQANPEIEAKRQEVLSALRAKYEAEDAKNPGELSPAEVAARAKEWANARAMHDPYPRPEPKGIVHCFDVPTRGGDGSSEQTYKVGGGRVLDQIIRNPEVVRAFDKTFGRKAFKDTKDGIEILANEPVGIPAALQLAQQRFRGGPIAVQGGNEIRRADIASMSIMYDIPVKGPDMESRVSEIRAMIDNAKEAILAKEGPLPIHQPQEPEHQQAPEREFAPEQTPEIQPEQAPEVQPGRVEAPAPAVNVHEDHLRAIAGQLESGTPTADPNIPGHVGYNAQGDNVCAMSDQNGQIRAWGVYGDDGKPLSTKGENGWKEALNNVVSEPLKERAIARETPTPEKESPSQEKSADDRDV